MNYGQSNAWTIDEEKKLTELCQHSHLYTASEMAEVLGKSRHAVIAKIRRKNIHWTNTRKPADPNKPKRVFSGKNVNYSIERKERNGIGIAQKIFQKSKKFHAPSGLIGDALWAGNGIRVIDLSNYQCRWPAKDSEMGDKQFCGLPVCEATPYCLDHARAAFQFVPAKRSIPKETPSVERVE